MKFPTVIFDMGLKDEGGAGWREWPESRVRFIPFYQDLNKNLGVHIIFI